MKKKLEVIKTKPNDKKMIYRLRISLDETEPEVWRRLLVPGKLSLEKLHLIFQIVMGWENSHLHEFKIHSKRYINPLNDPDAIYSFPPSFDERKVKIADVLSKKDRFTYDYDFGDNWSHSVVVEDVLSPNEIFTYPVCLDGANACPPEDSGGIHGYYALLEDLAQEDSKEHENAMAWVGGQFNPSSFDANRINRDVLWLLKW